MDGLFAAGPALRARRGGLRADGFQPCFKVVLSNALPTRLIALFKQLDEELFRSEHPGDSPAIECDGRLRPADDHTTARFHFSQLLLKVIDLVTDMMQTAASLRQKMPYRRIFRRRRHQFNEGISWSDSQKGYLYSLMWVFIDSAVPRSRQRADKSFHPRSNIRHDKPQVMKTLR
jgi:hypothetical protein